MSVTNTHTVTIADAVRVAMGTLHLLAVNCRQAYDKAPAHLRNSKRYTALDNAAAELECLPDVKVPASVKDLQIEYVNVLKSKLTRVACRDQAVVILEECIEQLLDADSLDAEDLAADLELVKNAAEELNFS